MTEPTVRPTRYAVSCVPEGYVEGDMFMVLVEYRGNDRWAVTNRGRSLSADGTWSWGYRGPGSDREPVTDEEHAAYEAGYEAWVAEHRFDEETALRLARQGVNAGQMQELLWSEHQINWNDYPDGCKRGRVTVRRSGDREVSYVDRRTRANVTTVAMWSWWETEPAPHFTADPGGFLAEIVPPLPTLCPTAREDTTGA
jgi:hypothetical protein